MSYRRQLRAAEGGTTARSAALPPKSHTQVNARMSKRGIVKKRDWKRKGVFERPSRVRSSALTVMPRVRALNGRGIGFPTKLACKLKYGQVFTVGTIIPGTSWYNIFRGNSIFDPDVSGTGHQPRYHDTLEALYKYYYVSASSIKVNFHASTAAGGILAFVVPDASTDSAAIPVSAHDVIELPGSRWKHMGAENTGPAPTTIRMRQTSSVLQEDDRIKATPFGGNPVNNWDFIVGMFNATASNTGGWVSVEIIYDVICSELVEPSQS